MQSMLENVHQNIDQNLKSSNTTALTLSINNK